MTDTRCPFDPDCKVGDPCPHPDACEWYTENRPGGHCLARDSDEVLLRYQIATRVHGMESPN